MAAADVRREFSAVVGAAQHAGRVTYITHHGRRVAAIVPADAAEWLDEYEDQELSRRSAESMADPAESVPFESVAERLGL